MSDSVCIPRQTAVCEEKTLQQAEQKACEEFSACLPFGGRLHSNGGCIEYDAPSDPPEDGVYGKVIVQNGCIAGVMEDESYQYAAAPCAPVPSPCDCDGEGGGVDISTQAGNLITKDASGALAAILHWTAGDGITITGYGTVANPLKISATGGSGGSGAGVFGEDHITVAYESGNYFVKHDKTGNGTQTYGTITVDEYGHVTGYNEEAPSGLTGVVSGEGITVDTNPDTGIATISTAKPLNAAEGDWTLGGYNATVDDYGRVTAMSRRISLPAGTYSLGDYDVTVNAYGSITGIQRNGGGGDDMPSGLSADVVFFDASLSPNANGYYVPFTLAKASPVRLVINRLIMPDQEDSTIGFSIDGSVDLSRRAGANVYYTLTTLSAGAHRLVMTTNTTGYIGVSGDIQPFIYGAVQAVE